MFFVYPLLRMIGLSLEAPGGPLAYYAAIVRSPLYMTVLGLTFRTALGVTVVCVLLGVPTAYVLARTRGPVRSVLLVAVVLPFLTSILIRTYAWMAILGRNGVVNQLLLAAGVVASPLPLMHNAFGVYVGMTHVLLPFMILPVYSVLTGIDASLLIRLRKRGVHGSPSSYLLRKSIPFETQTWRSHHRVRLKELFLTILRSPQLRQRLSQALFDEVPLGRRLRLPLLEIESVDQCDGSIDDGSSKHGIRAHHGDGNNTSPSFRRGS